MNKMSKVILCLEAILLVVCALVILANTACNSKDGKVPTYVLLDELKEPLSTVNGFELVGKWENQIIAALPLYPVTESYPQDATNSIDGSILATSVCIRGTFTNDLGDEITVVLAQDKTFENGGFIYMDYVYKNINKHNLLYKYKNCFIVLSCSFEIDMVTVYEFMSKLASIIGENYKETSSEK